MQTQPNFAHLTTVAGMLQANLIKSVLEAAGIPALTSGESAAAVYGFTVGQMAEVEVWVPQDRVEEAREIVERLESPPSEDESVSDDANALLANAGEWNSPAEDVEVG